MNCSSLVDKTIISTLQDRVNCSLPGNSLWTDPSVTVAVFDIFPFCLVHNTDRTDAAVIVTEVTSQIGTLVSMPFSRLNPKLTDVNPIEKKQVIDSFS